MNRQVSYNWIKEYVKLKASASEFAKEFSLKSQTVDRAHDLNSNFKHIITAKVVALEKHPNADKLKVATVDNGKEKLQIVCGAPNVAVGQVVALAQIGAKVFSAEDTNNQWEVKKASIRGIESSGMICSQAELNLGQDHSGIMILPADTPLGKPLEKVLPAGDSLLEIEITANRPDAMSVIGLAREAAAVFNAPFTYKEPKPNLKVSQSLPLAVKIEAPRVCQRYQGVVMTNVSVKSSPLWLQLRLLASGLRPINNVVDITNYVLLEYGKPLHVFDYQAVNGASIIVRHAKRGEKLLALDGKTYQLTPEHLVIADQKQPIAIAGVMGGEHTAATENTTTIAFESAVFDPVAIRKTARALNLHSESSDLFEKGLRPESVQPALLRAIELTQQLAGGQVASGIIDANKASYKPTVINFDPTLVSRYLGIEIPLNQIKTILQNLGFSVSGSSTLSITVPWWREGDISQSHDIIEEVARMYGYHNLPQTIPLGSIPVGRGDAALQWEDRIKAVLVGAGFSEIYNYSMVSAQLLEKAGIDLKDAIKIANPLSEDMEYLRTALLPQLLQTVSDNGGNFSSQHLFELSNIYNPVAAKQLPEELSELAGVVSGVRDAVLHAKGTLELVLKKMGITDALLVAPHGQVDWWQTGSVLSIVINDRVIGFCGLISRELQRTFGIEKPTAAFVLNLADLIKHASTVSVFEPVPEFPSAERDIAIVVAENISWAKIEQSIAGLNPLITAVDYLSTFRSAAIGSGKKSIAFRVVVRAADRTLQSNEVDQVVQTIVKKLEGAVGATLR